jgi:hypothetical protein
MKYLWLIVVLMLGACGQNNYQAKCIPKGIELGLPVADFLALPKTFLNTPHGTVQNASGLHISAEHTGIDFESLVSFEVVAPIAGRIRGVIDKPNSGFAVEIDSLKGSCAVLFMHMTDVKVAVGDWVKAGQIIGKAIKFDPSRERYILHYEFGPLNVEPAKELLGNGNLSICPFLYSTALTKDVVTSYLNANMKSLKSAWASTSELTLKALGSASANIGYCYPYGTSGEATPIFP